MTAEFHIVPGSAFAAAFETADKPLAAEEPVAVSGTVLYEGPPPVPQVIGRMVGFRRSGEPDEGPPVMDESLLVDPSTRGLANVVIYLDKVPAGVAAPPAPQALVAMAIAGGRFVPHVSVVRTGQTTVIANQEIVDQSVHTYPSRNETIRGLAAKCGAAWSYAKPEKSPVRIRADVCPWWLWMSAWQVVTDHPWVAVTDKDGAFSIRGLPPGKYSFKVWHEKPGYLHRALDVEVKAGEVTRLKLAYRAERFYK